MKYSVIIIAGNEEKNIEECLKSVQGADELILVDSESSDRTVEIARRFTDKVFVKKWEGYANQKKYALSLAANDWVLSLDADERATQELLSELKTLNVDEFAGFKIRRNNFFMGKRIKYCGWGRDFQLRFFRKEVTGVSDRLVHESFVVNGTIGRLNSGIDHFSYASIRDAMVKNNIYSSLEALEKYKRKKVSSLDLLLHPAAAFLQSYFLKQGFRDGIQGMIISLLHAVTNLQTYMKMKELQLKEKISK